MAHIHTNTSEHDLAVTAYIVRTDLGVPKALLHMHRKIGKLLPVGGHVELSENPWQALIREIKEESGYKIEQLEILQPQSRVKSLTDAVLHPYPISLNTHTITNEHFHTVVEYAFVANSEPNLDIKEGESTDQRWLTIDEIMALSNDNIVNNVKEVYEFIFNEGLTNWDHVDTSDYSSSIQNKLH